jgi:glycosyltransferase involved in cell wall biosynthesis
MQSSISVVIPCFNHEAFIGRAIDSVLASDGVDFELIVIDDGSTDGSRERLERYAGDARIQVHHQPNRGAHAALNRGLELAAGDVIFILDSDDAFDPRRLEVLTRRLRDNPDASLAASWIEIVDADDAHLGVKQAWHTLPPWPPPTPGPFLSALGDPRLALLETNWVSTTSNIAFPAALVREHGLRFAPLRYAHDWDFILSACRYGRIELVEEPLLRYRVHGANTIDEGGGRGEEVMRFEIMWVVARHAMRLIRETAGSAAERVHLRDLLGRSAPTFGRDLLFDQLLLLRGNEDRPPAEFDALTGADHPLRRAVVGSKSAGQDPAQPPIEA